MQQQAADLIDDPRTMVREAVARARVAQRAWGALTPRERAVRLRGLRGLLVRRMDSIVETICQETGKPPVEALVHEVIVLTNLVRTYERLAPRLLRPRRVGSGILVNKRATKLYEPYGVVGVISPWNFPFSLPGIPTVSALFAGNAVVLKPSEVTPRTGALIGELVREAVPDHPYLVQVLEGGAGVGAALVAGGVDKVAFIGSPGTGRRVLAGAAESLTPVVLELGGNDVAIVCEDADPERAAAGVLWGAMSNAGQVCMSTERALVADAVYDRFVSALVRELEGLRTDGGTELDVGPLIFGPQRRVVESVVEDAERRGARVVRAGSLPAEAGDRRYPPTLLLEAHREMRLHEEETFGPVLAVTRVGGEEEAIEIANSGRFGLNASVWTRSGRRGRRIARRLDAGSVIVNDSLLNFGISELPYGGVKESGYGRLQGAEGLLEFARVKSVTESRITMRRELLWFPYRERTHRLLKRAFRIVYSPRGRPILNRRGE